MPAENPGINIWEGAGIGEIALKKHMGYLRVEALPDFFLNPGGKVCDKVV
jgi:hypothetical protein